MLNLMLHCGAQKIDRPKLVDAPTPPRTRTWVPVPHSRLLDLVEETLTGNQMQVVNEAHALSNDGHRYFGLMEVVNGQSADDYNLVVGLRNSHDQTFPAALAIGSGVFVCDNLAFSAQVTIARRHTRFIERDLPSVVQRAVGQLTEIRVQQDQRIEAYKNKRFSDAKAHDLVVRALDTRVITATRVPKVVQEWRRPSHEEFTEGGRTCWRLFNAFTESLKGGNIQTLPRKTQALHGLLDSACGLSVKPAPSVA
jgi:hypothetical protein